MLELTAIVEALLDQYITAFASKLCIPCSGGLRKLASKPTIHHPAAAALLLDLLMFKPDLRATTVCFSLDLVWPGEATW